MHVITGGSYNGKSAWVKTHYQLDKQRSFRWISAYRGNKCPQVMDVNDDILILSGVELWVQQLLKISDFAAIREVGTNMIEEWLKWEQQSLNRHLVVIGSDISKGIVPLEREMREYRDAAGWFFQDLVANCSRFDLLWYGIARRMK